MDGGAPDISLYLGRAAAGEPDAARELLPLVYDELRALAHRHFDARDPGHTLEPTGLVHEAFLRHLGGDEPPSFERRAHFFGAAAQAMRRILVERARRSMREKRGGGRSVSQGQPRPLRLRLLNRYYDESGLLSPLARQTFILPSPFHA